MLILEECLKGYTMTKRIEYFDFLRGLAIIGVVAIHTTGIGYKFNDASLYFNITVIWRQILNFSVPMFLTISGYFLADKELDTLGKYFNFERKQIKKVLIPYVTWSIIYLVISFIRGATNRTLVINFLTFNTSAQFYFILLIIEYYILLPILQKLATVKGLILSSIISVLSCLAIFYFRYYTNIYLPAFIVGSAPSLLIFFVLGLYLKNNKISLNNKIIILFITIGLSLSLAETYLVYYKFGSISDSVTAIKVSSFMYSFFLIIFSFKNLKSQYNKTRLLTYIGNISFGIYLSHMVFIHVINGITSKFLPSINQNAIVKQIITILVTIICSTLFAMITKKLLKMNSSKYFGQ